MRLSLTLAFAAIVVVAFCVAIFALRGCQNELKRSESAESEAAEVPRPDEPSPDPTSETTVSAAPETSPTAPAAARLSPAPNPSPSSSEQSSPPTDPAASVATTSTEALASAQASVAAARQAAVDDPGKAFRQYAKAYSAVGSFPGDAACAAFAERIVPELRNAATQANSSAEITDDVTLIEE